MESKDEKDDGRLAINITVSPEEYEFVRLKAYLNRTSMAGYVRRLIAREKSKETGSGEGNISVNSQSGLVKPQTKTKDPRKES